MRDLRFAFHVLRRNPGFTLAAILIMALGIGANTAVFSAVRAVLLKPLPYRDPSRLVVALHSGQFPVSPADFLDYQSQATAFSGLEAAQLAGASIVTSERAENVPALRITAGMIPMLGVPPLLGRSFTQAEAASGTEHVVLGYEIWRDKFSSDPAIAGRTISLAGKPAVVSGVMPQGFQFAPFWATTAQLWRSMDIASKSSDRTGRSLRVFGRLRDGVTIGEARAQMATIAARLASAHPDTNTGLSISVLPLQEKVAGPIRPTLLLLFGTVGFLLIIACADISNLLLARATGRRREIATRLALGATRFQLVRQLSMESVILALAGGAAGVFVARLSLQLLHAVIPAAGIPRQAEIDLDPQVLLFAIGLSLLAGLAAGLMPALSASHLNVNEHLREGGRNVSESRGMRRTQSSLISLQVALALVLMLCAGLLARSLSNLQSVDPGFNPHHLLSFEVTPSAAIYDTPEKREALFARMAESIRALPGVRSVSAINHVPVGGDTWTYQYDVAGRAPQPRGKEFGAVYRVIRPGYFATMEIPVIAGRDITAHDDAHAPAVVLVNETLARLQWPGASAVGRQIVVSSTPMTIVGVVRNVRQGDWEGAIDPEMYLPYSQRLAAFGSSAQTFVVRADGAPDIDRANLGVDREVPVSKITPMEQLIADKLWRARVSSMLLSGFALIALALSAAGIYSVISYSVGRRTHELGLRVALGASRSTVLAMVYRESLIPVGLGLAAGMAAAWISVQALSKLLYNVAPRDPGTMIWVIACLVITSVAAVAWPALRATRSDPLNALRQ